MNPYPESFESLIEALMQLPGIGRRSAERIAVHILETPLDETRLLAETIWKTKKNLRKCRLCRNYAKEDLCAVCSDGRRDAQCLCVVERPSDIANIEKTGAYRGRYHALGGRLSPARGIGPKDLDIDSLLRHVDEIKPREIVIATGADTEGEATAAFIHSILKDSGARITRLGFGLPVGTPMEFADERTIQKAMDGRREIG